MLHNLSKACYTMDKENETDRRGGSVLLHIAIAEDDPDYAQKLQEYLEQYSQEKGEPIDITFFTDGDEIVEGYQAKYDLLLLDVEMPLLDGMTAAEEIRKRDSEVVIIFITNMPQYAIKGYAVDALDYVLKPVSYFAFTQRLERAVARMKRREKKFIVIPVKGGSHKIDISRLYYVESQGHTLLYHTANGTYSSRGTMKEAEAQLGGLHFCRGNSGYLINLEHVGGVKDGFALVQGEKLQLSRPRRNAFLEALTDYLGEVVK